MVTEPFAEKHTILVSRQFFMPSVKRAVQDSDFSFDKALHVIFAGEEADDLGGPRREFFKWDYITVYSWSIRTFSLIIDDCHSW